MKRLIAIMLAVGTMFFTSHATVGQYDDEDMPKIVAVECYNLKMRLNVPRIYDNMQSLGSRKY